MENEEVSEVLEKEEVAEINENLKNLMGDEDDRKPMDWPLPVYPLVARFDVQSITLEDGQGAIVVAIYTGAGASFGLLSQEGALALSSKLKKSANSLVSVKQ
jgi:hypothetical protein